MTIKTTTQQQVLNKIYEKLYPTIHVGCLLRMRINFLRVNFDIFSCISSQVVIMINVYRNSLMTANMFDKEDKKIEFQSQTFVMEFPLYTCKWGLNIFLLYQFERERDKIEATLKWGAIDFLFPFFIDYFLPSLSAMPYWGQTQWKIRWELKKKL